MSDRALAVAALAFAVTLSAPARADDPKPPPRRKAGELTLLYVAGIGWGGSIAVFADAAQYADRPAASADAGILLAPLTAGVGCLLPTIVDVAFGKRPGAAQTVTSAMVLAAGESVALDEYFSNRASTSFHTYTKDAAWAFGGTTVGLATGLALAALVRTTPGRAAWVETTGMFAGVFAAGVAGAASRPPNAFAQFGRENIRNVALTGALAGAAGITLGVGTATLLSPSVLRDHIIDLGWMVPAAVAVAACSKCQASDAFAAMTVAGGAGFVVAFLATIALPQAGLSSVRSPTAIDLAPFAMPLPTGGFEVGLGGAM